VFFLTKGKVLSIAFGEKRCQDKAALKTERESTKLLCTEKFVINHCKSKREGQILYSDKPEDTSLRREISRKRKDVEFI